MGILSREVLLLWRKFLFSDPFLERLEKPERLERLIERRTAGRGDPGRDPERSRSYVGENAEVDGDREKNDVIPCCFPDMA